MLNIINQKIDKLATKEEKYNYLREFLQILILKIIEEKGYFNNLAFVGGTALRIIYDLPRFSEDLDFSQTLDFDFPDLLSRLKKELTSYGFAVDLTCEQDRIVKASFIRFEQLLFKLKISDQKAQKLSIKLEIDTNPPSGFNLDSSFVNKEFLLQINHYDLPSLFAGKLHAILCRTYTKGRDFYDLLWFISKKINPNYLQLKNAYFQSQQQIVEFDLASLKSALIQRIEETDFSLVKQEIEKFLLNHNELKYFQKDNFLTLINNWSYTNV